MMSDERSSIDDIRLHALTTLGRNPSVEEVARWVATDLTPTEQISLSCLWLIDFLTEGTP